MPRMLAREDPSAFKTLPLLVGASLGRLICQVLDLSLNPQQMLVRRHCMEVTDPQRFVVRLASLGVSVRLTLNQQGHDCWMLVRQRRLDHGDIMLELVSGYVPAHELNLSLLTVIQEVAKECLVETVGGWLGGRFGDAWLPTPYQGSLRCRGNSHFVLTPLSSAARSMQTGSLCLSKCPRAYVHLPTASLQLACDIRLGPPRDAREPSLYHVDGRLESDPLVARLNRQRPNLYLLSLDQGHLIGGLFTLHKGRLRPVATRSLQLVKSFTIQDGWLVHEKRIRFHDWLALWPSSNGDQADGERDRTSA